ncbi:hypothetical protein HMPREF9333_02132 [Johnsonella ignava ATCC 51276]|uniref:HTH lysR-type domain-containing protein n=1 Tax=Johnsonella ignava ATCC 51276 TaxID=679200 RepID=G5GKN9_9FIRM|nr:LysR family transcriptional regulator [Johnsonella ignava]EHI54673.1 hypothetical protein HMPREF9333_02132 [Johnsonella ignava ATCC 51276]
MDISKLQLFSDIADTKNLSESAKRLGYTQSGVSHAVSKLELEIGVPLLKRTKHGVCLTNDAKLLLPKVHSILANYNKLIENVNSIRGLKKGSVSIGSYSSIARQWLPAVIKKFQELYPNINLVIHEGGIEAIEGWINEGTVDIGFLSWRKKQSFKFITLARDNLYAVTSKSLELPYEYEQSFPLKAFENYPFIASKSGVDSDVVNTFETAGIKPNIRFSCDDEHTIISMVANNLGISLLPSMFLEGHEDKVNIIPVLPCSVRTLGIGLALQKNVPAAAAFINTAKTVVKQFI